MTKPLTEAPSESQRMETLLISVLPPVMELIRRIAALRMRGLPEPLPKKTTTAAIVSTILVATTQEKWRSHLRLLRRVCSLTKNSPRAFSLHAGGNGFSSASDRPGHWY